MSDTRIADTFSIRSRFLRSIHLERDFDDPTAARGYVLTPQAEDYLKRLAGGLSKGSRQRAWRITGDYGVGKSSFALLLAHFMAGRAKSFSGEIKERLQAACIDRTQRLVPVLVTGSREPISLNVLRALGSVIDGLHVRGRRPKVLERLDLVTGEAAGKPLSDQEVIDLIVEASRFVRESEHGDGLLIILDELGKFLEFAANHPDRQDVFFLQLLAEAAARSGDTPLMVVGLLHQGFNAYADRLSEHAQREWQKVAGRFEEIIFDRPLRQTATLITSALNIPLDQLPRGVKLRARADMTRACALGWYGPHRQATELEALAPSLYPLHSTLLPVLARLFARFGQNERSLFSFLLSMEPFGLQAFAEQPVSPTNFYRIHNLYDYARATIGYRLSAQSYRSHWNLIESVVESFATEQAVELRILKTVAMLNLVDDQGLLATADAIELAVAADEEDAKAVRHALQTLQKRRVLYLRGSAGGYCLWPHTSVDIDKAYAAARKAVVQATLVTSVVATELDARPVVARRHYIETGNLRHFSVRAVPVSGLSDAVRDLSSGNPDGLIVLPLCETGQERITALEFAQSSELKALPQVLVAVPRPLEMLANMVLEVTRWQWVQEHTPELIHDKYASEEVSRQLHVHRQMLRDRIQAEIGLRTFSGKTELNWFRAGKSISIASNRELLTYLSKVCDQVFDQAPTVRNELINRRGLSSAAASARMRLIECLFDGGEKPFLGMDTTKKPPEMSMYLSVLQRGRMHVKHGDRYAVAEPRPSDDPLNVRPVFARILEKLRGDRDARVNVARLFEELRRPPFGVRDGLLPLLLAVFAVVHVEDVAFYEEGAFLRSVGPEEFLRLSKNPDQFEMQYCRVSGVRATVFNELVQLLGPNQDETKSSTVLEVVRPLCVFAAQLPRYSQKTKHLSVHALAVRNALSGAQEPAMLVFRDLPVACDFEPFGGRAGGSAANAKAFVATLKKCLDELQNVYPSLLSELREQVSLAFDRQDSFPLVRESLAKDAERLLATVHEPKLKGFCLRLADRSLPEQNWLEALAGFLSGKPPSHWNDTDIHVFREELFRLARTFLRVVAAAFTPGVTEGSYAVRVALTMGDGSDVQRVVQLSDSEEKDAKEMEAQIREIIRRSRRIGMAAISRVMWRELSDKKVD